MSTIVHRDSERHAFLLTDCVSAAQRAADVHAGGAARCTSRVGTRSSSLPKGEAHVLVFDMGREQACSGALHIMINRFGRGPAPLDPFALDRTTVRELARVLAERLQQVETYGGTCKTCRDGESQAFLASDAGEVRFPVFVTGRPL
jgi:hypothetical protein